MAELIPLEYRLNIMRQRLIGRWAIVNVLVAAVAGAGLFFAYHWQQQRASELDALSKTYQKKSELIKQAKDLQTKRIDLAARMQKMQELRDDTILQSLLKNVSESFTDSDSLKYLRIDAHPQVLTGQRGEKGDPNRYSVRIQGITKNDSTHSQLLERLTDVGKKSVVPFSVPLGEKRIETVLDGEATLFDITCDKLAAKGD